MILLFRTCITDSPEQLFDLYFAFDNTKFFVTGYQNIAGHPLLAYITKPFIILGDFFIDTFGYKSKGILFISLCTTLISLSIIYVYRYLKEIVRLRGYFLYALVCMNSLFSTNLILCFTTESFTITTFLLSLSVYYYSSHIIKNKKIAFIPNLTFAILLGGTTITNFPKGIIPMLFLKEERQSIIKKICIISAIFLSILLLLEIRHGIFSEIFLRYKYFSGQSQEGTLLFSIFDIFLGAPILFPEIIWNTTKIDLFSGESKSMIDFALYQYWWQSLLVGLILGGVAISIYKNYRNRLVQMLTLLFVVDITLHIILRFGVSEGFLYGGHWIYVIPLFWGWLYKSLNKIQQKICEVVISCMLLIIALNNGYQLFNFINIAMERFPQ